MQFKDRTDLPEHLLKAIEKYETIKDNPELYYEALNLQMGIMDQIQRLDDATQLGLELGMEKGMEKGLEMGIKEGVHQVAKKMKEQGLDAQLIQNVTGLDLETIAEL